MELQFYGPGWVPQFDGFGCTATKWCANMTIDSLSDQDNTGISQNADCLNNHFLAGEEPINWAYITKSGKSLAPANPLSLSDGNGTGLSVDPAKVLLFNPGDVLRMHMHDTPVGYRVDITDMTTGQSGSMTASIANGFGHILFQPNAKHCHVAPYAFHPMYNSAVPRGSLWGAHNTNVGASDEIGHFEYCDAIDPSTGACSNPGAGDTTLDEDDQFCLDGSNYPGVQSIIGCVLDDGDFDGPSYQNTWPGTFLKPRVDRRLHGTAFMFTPPSSNGKLLENVWFGTTCRALSAASRATISRSATAPRAHTAPIHRSERSSIRSTPSPGRTAAAGSSRAVRTSRARRTPSVVTPPPSTAPRSGSTPTPTPASSRSRSRRSSTAICTAIRA